MMLRHSGYGLPAEVEFLDAGPEAYCFTFG